MEPAAFKASNHIHGVRLILQWWVSSLMSYKKLLCLFISDSGKVLKSYSWIQLAIVYLNIHFQSQKILTLLDSFVYFHFWYNLLSNNSNTNETVKIHRRPLDLLNYTIRIAFKQVVL